MTEYDVTEAMIRFGGNFVQQLGRLIRSADTDNKRRLVDAFPEYLAKYREVAARVGSASAKDQPDLAGTEPRLSKSENGDQELYDFISSAVWALDSSHRPNWRAMMKVLRQRLGIGSVSVPPPEHGGVRAGALSAEDIDATSRTHTGSFDRSVDSDPRAAVTTETRPNDELGRKTERAVCGLCGKPMPEGEEMFNYHGYSGPCPQ